MEIGFVQHEYVKEFFSIIAAVLFIISLRGLSAASTSRRGNFLGVIGMAISMIFPFFLSGKIFVSWHLLLVILTIFAGGSVGFIIAKKINMTALPQLLAAFHSLVGLAAVVIAGVSFYAMERSGLVLTVKVAESVIGAVIGVITFIGSVIAFGKLQGVIKGLPWKVRERRKINLYFGSIVAVGILLTVVTQSSTAFFISIFIALIFGVVLIMPIGGADMPVVISMLNSYSGWATAGIGFSTDCQLLIIVGALVGTSGAILSHIMCKGMNRSLLSVICGGDPSSSSSEIYQHSSNKNVKLCDPSDAGFILKNASSVIIVPGYGMAVARAQHAIKELADELKSADVSVKYAIHPVAGRMPGHMNVLLAEANIPYEDVFELDDINHEFGSVDVTVVVGANDITNPAAKNDPSSPIYGMPVLDVEKSKVVLFIKRSLGAGYAGIENQLFYKDNTMMLLGDAKKVCEELLKAIK